MYPGNTILAARESAPLVDMVELDVRQCGSGELIAFHDETLDEKTDMSGTVAEMDWETIKTATVQGSEETIPLLEDIVDVVPADTGINLDVKSTDTERMLEIAADQDNEFLYSSFGTGKLEAITEQDANAQTAFLMNEGTYDWLDMDPVEKAAEMGCQAVHPWWQLATDRSFVEQIHGEGMEINVWTVDVPEAKQVAAVCVGGVIVDDCAAFGRQEQS
jgi:glycerophosphoryl diester phosphodiesterase